MMSIRVITLISAFCLVCGVIICTSSSQAKNRKEEHGHKIHKKTNERWEFWFEAIDGSLHDEMFTNKRSCESAQKNWSKDGANGPIIFRCARLTPQLLSQATNKCSRNEKHGCEWQSMIQAYLDSR
jgi:hypothetical protein